MTRRAMILLAALASLSHAYYFGKNKVQYRGYSWKILQSEHFDIYYYEGCERLAQFAIPILEEAFEEYSAVFPKVPKDPVPVIIYSSPRDFQATNVILELLDEGVGGFTEIYKKRVVVPYTGSYEEFRHVLRHELVHVFQYLMLERWGGMGIYAVQQVPLWVMEGTAEYFSEGWSTGAESFMRDAVINDYVVPLDELAQYGGYIVYKEGQAAFRFLEERYGKDVIKGIISRLAGNPSISEAVKGVLNMDMEQLAKEFSLYNKKKYYGYVSEYEFPTERFKRLTDHNNDRGWMNVGPALSPKGDRLAVISDRTGYTDIYLLSLADGRVLKRLVAGQKTPDLENLHLLRPGICFSPDGSKLAFISQGTRTDILHIVNSETGRTINKIPLVGVDAAYTPAWSPKGDLIVFVGTKGSSSDLYSFRFSTGKITQLTFDQAEERDPSFSEDGNRILYASDKREGEGFLYGSYALWELDLLSGMATRLSPYLGFVGWPAYYGNGIAFVGEYQGSRNLMLWRSDSLFLLTKFLTEIKDISWSADRERLTFSMLWEGGYDVFVRTGPLEPLTNLPVMETPSRVVDTALYAKAPKTRYTTKMSMDWVSGGMSYSSAYGSYGTVTMGFSDVLGNFRIEFMTDVYSQDITDANFYLGFLWLPLRLDYGFDLYQFWNLYWWPGERGDTVVSEKDLGVQFSAQYPFNRFRRLETGLGYSYLTWYRYYFPAVGDLQPLRTRYYNQFTGYMALVHDDVLYSYSAGPLSGQRAFAGLWTSLPGSALDTKTGIVDMRKYWRITPRGIWAWRLKGGRSFGETPLPLYVGGATTIRGYPDYWFTGQNLVLLNSELRIPVIDHLKLGFLPIELSGLRGVVFYDMGSAWFDWEPFIPFADYGWFYRLNNPDFPEAGLYAGLGFGFRLYMGYFTLKTDFARRTDWAKILSKEDDGLPNWVFHLSFGSDF